jgi:hypothetical protein
VRTTSSSPDVPWATASRASTSASITTAPSSSNSRVTALLPEPMPPVTTTRITRLSLPHAAGGQACENVRR